MTPEQFKELIETLSSIGSSAADSHDMSKLKEEVASLSEGVFEVADQIKRLKGCFCIFFEEMDKVLNRIANKIPTPPLTEGE